MHIFATHDDLLPVFDHVEGLGPLDYVLFGHQPTSSIRRLASGRDIPGLGAASCDSAVACAKYVLVPRGAHVEARLIQALDGDRYAIDLLHNVDAITFGAGGRWRADVLLHGRVSTVSSSPIALMTLRRFEAAIRKRFEKIGAFRVGPGAVTLMEQGVRLCGAEQSPTSHDLRRQT